MSYPTKCRATSSWVGLARAFFAVIFLSACLNGGGGGPDAGSSGGSGGPIAPPPPAPVVAPNLITAFSDAGGGNVTVTAVKTPAPGAIIVISGTTSYNGTFTVVSATATTFNISASFVANDATGGWIAGGGVIAGCTTTGATGAISLPPMTAVASRFTGVAPLSVFFDATATTGVVTQPFHEMLYAWNFGDPGSGTWEYGNGAGSSSKNAATGAVAAHVYETPGIYTASLSVTDGTNAVTNNCILIAVQDPNLVFAGANTRCYTQGAVSAGSCPGGGTEITSASADFKAIVAADLLTGRRLLFARGETWTTSDIARLNVNGPWTVGAYGAGAKPIVQRGGGSIIVAIGANGSDLKDGRVMDLEIKDDRTNNVVGVNGGGTFDQLTFLRVDISDVAQGFSFGFTASNLVRMWDQLTIADSTVRRMQIGGQNPMFLAASRMAIFGNSVDNEGGGEHNFRSMFFNKLVLSNNKFVGPAATKHNITLRAPEWATGNGPIPPNTYSQLAVVSDNELIGGVGVSISVNSSNDAAFDARTRYIIFERNWMHDQPGAGISFSAIRLNSDFSTVRNNVFDLSGISSVGEVCLDIRNNSGTSPNPTTNWFYNNTCYSTTAYNVGLPIRGMAVDATAINTTVKNNLLFVPNATVATVVDDAGVGTIGASGTFGNSSNTQAISGPVSFTSLASPLTPAGAKPTAGYVIGGGVVVPGEIVDFFLRPQPATPDIGAVLN